MSSRLNLAALSACLCLALPAIGATVELSAEAGVSAPNDLLRATVAADVTGATPAEVARRSNSAIADALKTAKTYSSVKTRTGGAHTYPAYSSKGKIEGWQMRSELQLESRDPVALGELLGKLQTSLVMGGLSAVPAPETRAKAEERAMLDAIAAFHARAKVIAGAFGKPYKIKTLNVASQGGQVRPLLEQRMTMAKAAPMPVEPGESQVTIVVSGQIEIPD